MTIHIHVIPATEADRPVLSPPSFDTMTKNNRTPSEEPDINLVPVFAGLCLLLVFIFNPVQGDESPAQGYKLYDMHLHYNQSVWQRLPPEQAIRFLLENNIQRAVFSSTPERGTEMLYEIAPERVIPFIRPYRTYDDVPNWHHNPEILDYISEQADKGIYRGFGEFHMGFKHLDGKSIVPQLMQIAAEQNWVISAHTDMETIEALIAMQPTLPIVWAHCGFSYEAHEIRALVEKYPTAYCDMSLYEKLVDEDDNLTPQWKALMEDHPDRFMVAIDTYKESRWGEVREHAQHIQEWLAQLSPDAARMIANGNVNRLLPVRH